MDIPAEQGGNTIIGPAVAVIVNLDDGMTR
jgi:hypothetical protein